MKKKTTTKTAKKDNRTPPKDEAFTKVAIKRKHLAMINFVSEISCKPIKQIYNEALNDYLKKTLPGLT